MTRVPSIFRFYRLFILGYLFLCVGDDNIQIEHSMNAYKASVEYISKIIDRQCDAEAVNIWERRTHIKYLVVKNSKSNNWNITNIYFLHVCTNKETVSNNRGGKKHNQNPGWMDVIILTGPRSNILPSMKPVSALKFAKCRWLIALPFERSIFLDFLLRRTQTQSNLTLYLFRSIPNQWLVYEASNILKLYHRNAS